MKKIVALLSVLCAFLATGAMAEVPAPAPIAVTILHTSDLHAHLLPFDTASGTGMGGYARIKAYREAVEASGRRVLLVSSGDVFQGTLFFRFFEGVPDVSFMNQSGYAAMALGNHEFDKGPRTIVDAFGAARFPILAANLQTNPQRYASHRQLVRLVRPWTIIEIGEGPNVLKLGLIGLLDERLGDHVPRAYLQGLAVEDAAVALRRELPRLKAAGAEAVIALSHLGWNRDVELAAAFPEVAGFCGGHTHLSIDPPLVCAGANGHQFLSQPGEWGAAVSRIDVVLHPPAAPAAGRRLEVKAAGLVPMSADLPEDPVIKKTAEQLWAQVRDKVARQLGDARCRLNGDRPQVRQGETNLGNVAADAMLAAAPADLAVVNGGGIRCSIEAGPITIGDCLNVMPFDNSLVKLTMTGAMLEKLFAQVRENMLQTPGFGGFLQVSRGLVVHYGVGGNRVSLQGAPLDPTRKYIVTTIDFLAGGGNGLTAFCEATASETVPVWQADALMRYVEREKVLAPQIEGRIIRDVKLPEPAEPARAIRVPRPPRPR